MAKSPENQSIEIIMNAFYAQNQKEMEALEGTSEKVTKFISLFINFMNEQKISSAKFNTILGKLEEQKRAQFETKGRRSPTEKSLDRDIRKILKEEFQTFRSEGKGTLRYSSKSEFAQIAFAPLKETAPNLEKVNTNLKATQENLKKLDEGLKKAQKTVEDFTQNLGSGSKVLSTVPAVVQGNMGSGTQSGSANGGLGSKASKAASGPRQLPVPVGGANLPGFPNAGDDSSPKNRAEQVAQGNKFTGSIKGLGDRLVNFFSGKPFWGKMLDTIVGGLIASKLLANTFWDTLKLLGFMLLSGIRNIFGKEAAGWIGTIAGMFLGTRGLGAAFKGAKVATRYLKSGKGLGTAIKGFSASFAKNMTPKWMRKWFKGNKFATKGTVAAVETLPMLTEKKVSLLTDSKMVSNQRGISKFLNMAHGAQKEGGVASKVAGATSKVTEKISNFFTKSGATAAKESAKSATKTGAKLAAKETAKTVGKAGAKVVGKKIPILGALYGLSLGAGKFGKGDYLGGAGEIASGLLGGAGLFTGGASTAASVALDAWLLKRDADMASGKKVAGVGKPIGEVLKGAGKSVGGFLKGTGRVIGTVAKGAGGLALGALGSLGKLGKIFGPIVSSVVRVGKSLGSLASIAFKLTKNFGLLVAAIVGIGAIIKKIVSFFGGKKGESESNLITKTNQDVGDKVLETAQEPVAGKGGAATSPNKNLSIIAQTTTDIAKILKNILDYQRDAATGGSLFSGVKSLYESGARATKGFLNRFAPIEHTTPTKYKGGEIDSHRITSQFGDSEGRSHQHGGVDFAYNRGEKVTAKLGGKIVKIGWDEQGYGKYIAIDTGDAFTVYGHLDSIGKGIAEKKTVKQGDVLGEAGGTGAISTGPHLHYEVRKKDPSRGYTKFESMGRGEGRTVTEKERRGFSVDPIAYTQEKWKAQDSIPTAARKEIQKDLENKGFSKEQAQEVIQSVTDDQAVAYVNAKTSKTPALAPQSSPTIDENQLYQFNQITGSRIDSMMRVNSIYNNGYNGT